MQRGKKNTRRHQKRTAAFSRYIIGIDEAGRGPLVGPVVVAGICVKSSGVGLAQNADCSRIDFGSFFKNIRDSKKTSEKKREEWYQKITKNRSLRWAVAVIGHDVIDTMNILKATHRGAYDVYKKLAGNTHIPALLDGGLFLPKPIPYQAIIKGDEKISIISAASIIAKVTRDRIMLKLHKKYPQYRFDLHKGYSTKLHRALIKKFGRSKIHRKSFRVD